MYLLRGLDLQKVLLCGNHKILNLQNLVFCLSIYINFLCTSIYFSIVVIIQKQTTLNGSENENGNKENGDKENGDIVNGGEWKCGN